MSEKVERDDETKLPYEPPAITWVAPLEAQPSLMAGCGKVTDADCNATPPPRS